MAPTITAGGGPVAGGLGIEFGSGCGGRSVGSNLGSFSGSGKGRLICGGGAAMPTVTTRKLGHVTWDVASSGAFTQISFALVGANDRKRSRFSIDAEGASWAIASRQKRGGVQWVTILFKEPVERAKVTFKTSRKDKFGIAGARVIPASGSGTGPGPLPNTPPVVVGPGTGVSPAPVPLPPAALLLGAGIATLAGLRRRRRPAV